MTRCYSEDEGMKWQVVLPAQRVPNRPISPYNGFQLLATDSKNEIPFSELRVITRCGAIWFIDHLWLWEISTQDGNRGGKCFIWKTFTNMNSSLCRSTGVGTHEGWRLVYWLIRKVSIGESSRTDYHKGWWSWGEKMAGSPSPLVRTHRAFTHSLPPHHTSFSN